MMQFWKKHRVIIRSEGKHRLVIHNEIVHDIEDKGNIILIAGKEYQRSEAVRHLKNMSVALDHVAKQLER